MTNQPEPAEGGPHYTTYERALVMDHLGRVRVLDQRYYIDSERWYTKTVEVWTSNGWQNVVEANPHLPDVFEITGTVGDNRNKTLDKSEFCDMSALYRNG